MDVIQDIDDINELKEKLREIIELGNNYEFNVTSCLTALLRSNNQSIVTLAVQAIAEIAKCDVKRASYAVPDVINTILSILQRELTVDSFELIKQALRAIGNLCCDCDTTRDMLVENEGISILMDILKATMNKAELTEIKLLVCKTFLNFAIGGQKYSECLIKENMIELLMKMLKIVCFQTHMDDYEATTALQLLSVTNENDPELVYDDGIILAVMKVLEETTSVEVSELCLELLYTQAENDSIKSMLASENRVQLVCERLEQLVQRLNTGDVNPDGADIEAVMKQACDLIIIILTGDEAMEILYDRGKGEVYECMIRWLDSANHQLLTTGTLAIGNFARRDEYCAQMMENHIFDKLLGIFQTYNSGQAGVDEVTANKVQHAALGALRNLSVPERNKRQAARAAPALVAALPAAADPRLADQLLAALRLLLDEESALALSSSPACLAALATWGQSSHARASAEASRLLARAARMLDPDARARLAEEEGCVTSLVSMMVAPHSLMQSEAILALTLIAAALPVDAAASRLRAADLAGHAALLLDSNCGKMPVPVAENLLALLELTAGALAPEFRRAHLSDSLQNFVAARADLSRQLEARVDQFVAFMAPNN